MQLYSLGGPTIKIKYETASSPDGEVTILCNPHGSVAGLPKLRKQGAHIVLVSRREKQYYDASSHDPKAFVVNTPGEYEVKNVLINAQEQKENGNDTLLFRLGLDNVSLGYLGGLAHPLKNGDAIEYLEGIDVLIVPVGGKGVLSGSQAMQLVTQLEPRMVIPIEYRSARYPTARDSVNVFVKEFGVKEPARVSKLKITRKDLPQDERVLTLIE